jgi:cell division inhibitor SulA
MKLMGLALAVVMLSTVTGWAEQLKPGEQAHASVAAHRGEAQNNQERHKGRRHHRRHHRKHQGA